jgi:hypothetical protein
MTLIDPSEPRRPDGTKADSPSGKPWSRAPGCMGLLAGFVIWHLIAYTQGDFGGNPIRVRYELSSATTEGDEEALQRWLERQPQVHSPHVAKTGRSLVIRYTYLDGEDGPTINAGLNLESLPIRFGFGSAESIFVGTYSQALRSVAHVFAFYRLDNWLGGLGFVACLFVGAITGDVAGRALRRRKADEPGALDRIRESEAGEDAQPGKPRNPMRIALTQTRQWVFRSDLADRPRD